MTSSDSDSPAMTTPKGTAVSAPIPTLGQVGFSSLPDQLVRKAVHHRFFNLMCIGETGIGKSTLMEAVFSTKLQFPPCPQEMASVELLSRTIDVEEGGVKLKLTLVETAGFGGQLEPESGVKVIVKHIKKQFAAYLEEEMKVDRRLPLYQDTRIHACLYLISPLGHGLKELDVAALKDLYQRVNIILVIAQADTLSEDDLLRLKAEIMMDLRSKGIEVYKFPEDDKTVKAANIRLNACLPFAVGWSKDFMREGAQQHPRGIVDVENEDRYDFVELREALNLNVEDLYEHTHRVLYEKYRQKVLRAMDVDGYINHMFKTLEAKKAKEDRKAKESKDRFAERQRAMENEMMETEKAMQDLVEEGHRRKKARLE